MRLPGEGDGARRGGAGTDPRIAPLAAVNASPGCFMTANRILGLVIVAAGIVLLIFGINATHAPLERVSDAVTGRYTNQTMWYIIGGVIAVVGGGLLAIAGRRRG